MHYLDLVQINLRFRWLYFWIGGLLRSELPLVKVISEHCESNRVEGTNGDEDRAGSILERSLRPGAGK